MGAETKKLLLIDGIALRASPSDRKNGQIVLYFDPSSVEPVDPKKFCRESGCSWFNAHALLACEGPVTIGALALATAKYRQISPPVFSVRGVKEESACGANVRLINNSQMAQGG